MSIRNRIEVMHGVNLDQLGRRPAAHYGDLNFEQLQFRIDGYGAELDLLLRFFQTNAEHEFVEHLHRLDGLADGVVLNPGAWTHYSIAVRDACSQLTAPLVEVHISNIHQREEFRHHSVISAIASGVIVGLGVEGYLLALRWLSLKGRA